MAINSDIVSIRQGASAFDETNVLNETGHKNMLHLIHLRWLAVGGQIATILVATWGFDIKLPMFNMLAVMVCLIAFNIGSHLRWHEERVVSNRELFLAMLVDIASLTAQLFFYYANRAQPAGWRCHFGCLAPARRRGRAHCAHGPVGQRCSA